MKRGVDSIKIIVAVLIAWLVGTEVLNAQADFRFYVFDETRTEKLHYELAQDITVYDWAEEKPRLVYYTEYRVYGVKQDEFSYTTESYDGDLPRTAYKALLTEVRMLPVDSLNKAERPDDERSFGWINVEGVEHQVSSRPKTEARLRWQSVLDGFLKKNAPIAKRKVSTRSVEGETVKPREIDFRTLLSDPKRYDGKRLRIHGFYHHEFECSDVASSKGDDHQQTLWLGAASTFAEPKAVRNVNDALVTVEGTLDLELHGHMGLWMGELVRLTTLGPLAKGK